MALALRRRRCPGGPGRVKLRAEFVERRNGGPKRRRRPVRTAKGPRRTVQSLRFALREDRGSERCGSGRGRPGVVRRGNDGLFGTNSTLIPAEIIRVNDRRRLLEVSEPAE